MCGLGLLVRGSLSDKVEFVFKMYDLGNDGGVSKEELHTVLSSIILSASIILEETVLEARRKNSVTEGMVSGSDSEDQKESPLATDIKVAPDAHLILDNQEALDVVQVQQKVTRMVNEAFTDAKLKDNQKLSKAQFESYVLNFCFPTLHMFHSLLPQLTTATMCTNPSLTLLPPPTSPSLSFSLPFLSTAGVASIPKYSALCFQRLARWSM